MGDNVEGKGDFQPAPASFKARGSVTIELPMIDQSAQAFSPEVITSVPEELREAIFRATPAHHDLAWKLWLLDPESGYNDFVLEVVERSTGNQLFGPTSFESSAEMGAAAAAFLEDLAGL
jgi:hypothetical protein